MSDGGRIQVAGVVEDGKYLSLTEAPQPAMVLPTLQQPPVIGYGLGRRHPDLERRAEFHLISFTHGERDGCDAAITGIFGTAAYSVSRRLKELGIRMALGARRKEVLQAALGRALKLLAWGSAAGLLLGILASRVPATWIPAQCALSLDPATLLREK
jgi:hypothetical protein